MNDTHASTDESGEHLVAKALAAEPPLPVSIGLTVLGIAMAVGAVLLQHRRTRAHFWPARRHA